MMTDERLEQIKHQCQRPRSPYNSFYLEMCVDLLTEIDRLKALTEWQPIETAPKDGTRILACADYVIGEQWGAHAHPQTVRWETYYPNAPGKGLWRDKNGHKQMHLTHWTPLPKPPEVKS